MSQLFDKIKVGSQKRSTFDLSHNQVMTSDFGYLTPICVRDMVPNDDFVVSPQLFTRLAPLAVPTYGRIKCRVHHFFVPYRILYPLWDSFITQDPNNSTVPPYFTVSVLRQALAADPQYSTGTSVPRNTYGRLMANLGINPELLAGTTGLDANDRISALPFLAYYRIWLDWFMDSSIYDHSALDLAFKSDIANGGSMAAYTYYLLTRNSCFKKDYFTTAKLNPQGGSDPATVGVDLASPSLNPALYTTNTAGVSLTKRGDKQEVYISSQSGTATKKVGEFSVEALRAANSLQRYLERNNFVGTKIINRILAHFGISPTPERLDMAEFIDGDSFSVTIGDVTSTSSNSGDTSGLGYQAGKGLGVGSTKSVRYHAKEHGVFMSIMSILPDNLSSRTQE